MNESLYLGIDGGGTNCRARLVDSTGKLLGEGYAGSANVLLGMDRVFAEVMKATMQALGAAGLGDEALGRLHVGAGLGACSLDSAKATAQAHPTPFASWKADSDGHIALLGAHAGGDGAILILGTGSLGWARVKGTTFTVGGWGLRLSDHGSGGWIGWEAIRRSLLAFDGVEEETQLTQAVLKQVGGNAENAVLWAEKATPGDFGKLAKVVVKYAEKADPLAQVLMRHAAADAAQLLFAMHRRGAERITLVGGFSTVLRPWLPRKAAELLSEPLGDPMDGALRLAREETASNQSESGNPLTTN